MYAAIFVFMANLRCSSLVWNSYNVAVDLTACCTFAKARLERFGRRFAARLGLGNCSDNGQLEQ